MPIPSKPELARLARLAARVELRMRIREALKWLFLGLLPTLTALAGFVLWMKVTHGAHGRPYVALLTATVVFATATFVGILWAFLRRLPAHIGAITLDASAKNQDRVTNALVFAGLPDDARTPLMDAAIEDATLHVERLRPAVAVPLGPSFLTSDVAFAVGLALLVGGLTTLQWSRRTVIPRAATIDAVTLSADDIDLFRDTLKELAEKDPSPETQAALQQFNQLVEDLADKRLDRAEAFRRMDALEKGLLKGREGDAKALEEALKHAAEKLKDSPLSKPAGEALAKKDYAAAEKEMKELAKKLKDKQSKITEADKKRLKEALSKAAKSQKETIAKLKEAREQMRASLLQREQKANQSEEEKRLLQRDKRELERLDREIAEKEKAERQLDRLDRELSQAAEDLMKDLGLTAEDLERAAEDINRMAREELSEKEKEQLRQKLQELRELLRQEGQGGKELKKRLKKFAKKAKGGAGEGEKEEGKGKGKKGEKKPGEDGEEDDDDGDEEGEKGKGKKGKGQGEGEGEGEFVIGPGGKKTFKMKGAGNKPGQGDGPGQAPGQGPPGGAQPGGPGSDPGSGKQWGTGHDGNIAGKATAGKHGTYDVQAAASDTGQGPSVSETIKAAADRGFVGKKYKRVYADYRTKAEEAMKNEDIPPGYKFYVQRYFQLIRPRE